jgi:hypothetical protein
MKIIIDENGYVREYAVVGDIPNSIQYDGGVPDDFDVKFRACRIVNGALVLDQSAYSALCTRIQQEEELAQIEDWYKQTDYIALKVLRENWEESDPRYQQYLKDYAAKHARAEEIKSQM